MASMPLPPACFAPKPDLRMQIAGTPSCNGNKRTLVVVSADQETGSMAINKGSLAIVAFGDPVAATVMEVTGAPEEPPVHIPRVSPRMRCPDMVLFGITTHDAGNGIRADP